MTKKTTTTASTKRRRRWPWWTLGGVFALLAALYIAGYFLTGSRMPANTTVAQVDVGGKTPSDAVAALEEGTADRIDAPIIVSRGEQSFELVPADIGLEFDAEASIERAGGGRSWDPRRMVGLIFGDRDYHPVLTVDDDQLASAVDTIAETVDQPVVEAFISFPEGAPEPREPEAGELVEHEPLAEAIRTSYLMSDDPVEIPVETVEPQVDSEGLAEAMSTIAEPAVSGPVILNVGEQSIELPVTAYTPALTVEVEDGTMAAKIDEEALAEPLTDSTTGIGEKAVDAVISIENDTPVITPSQPGLGLDPATMAAELLPVITEEGEARAITVEATPVDPQFTTEDAEALGITEKISTFSTNYPHADYRNINQGRAAEIINGTLLKPGETFSFNDTVGERTVANGFAVGTVINGGVFREEMGGGVSQVVTTTYNAAFFAGLEDVEHHPHAFYIDRYPVGREATVYYGSLDLRFKNSLDNGVLIRSYISPSGPGGQGTMTVEMWGTKQFDIEAGESPRRNFRQPGTRYDDTGACVPQAPTQGFDIDIIRIFRQNGQEVNRESVTANYQAADRVVCGPQPGGDD
ncbi:VanW family protein [Aeromicrobium sp. YIM 150415]|uniref:VanW family protein n=1 Tax=Aeromicrobium sp. YIM 150415 TaxID=2803912 RepID=UPI0019657502|nr:VanW family protein [Aeromicrobium sp. YIM 150415]MBM9465620.1 VanW family protein [Aeromicrobium sp. YIM 150415]